MDPEEKRLLDEVHALARDNHRMLREVRRHQILVDFGHYILWLIAITFAVFYYLVELKPRAEQYQVSNPTASTGYFDRASEQFQNFLNTVK